MGERERERERDRDRVRANSDASLGSLWIEYVLLPRKLDEHLAALASGSQRGPLPADLITMFLEQVLVNHKATLANNCSASREADDQDPASGTRKMVGRTTALLCERAARVAVASNFSLADIEASIPSQQHQFLLLRALINHDKIRLLLHVCNLHRWRTHNALHSHYLGLSASNGLPSSAKLNSWMIEEDLADLFKGPETGGFDIQDSAVGGRGECGTEEESSSVEFLERIFYDDQYSTTAPDDRCGRTDVEPLRIDEKSTGILNCGNRGFVHAHHFLSSDYRCQALFDVAEVHFMRGRLERALDLFTLCGELFARISLPAPRSGCRSQESVGPCLNQNVAFPKDRLAGFIVACRMLLAKDAASRSNRQEKADISKGPLPELGAPSPIQCAVIACEQIRWFFTNRAQADARQQASSLQKLESAIQIGSRPKRCREEREFVMTSSKRSTSYAPPGPKGEYVERICEKLGEGTSHLANGVLGGDQLVDNTLLFSIAGPLGRLGSQKQCPGPQKESGDEIERLDASTIGVADSLEQDTGHMSHSVSWQDVHGAKSLAVSLPFSEGKELVQTFVNNLTSGFLPWSYCLSLEKDPNIPDSVQCHLAACNIVREVAEGAPVESFLRISQQLKKNKEAMGFILNLVKSSKCLEKVRSGEGQVFVKLMHCRELKQEQTFLAPKREEARQKVIELESLAERMDELAFYMCCVIDKPWCWALATEVGFAVPSGAVNLSWQNGFEEDNDLERRMRAREHSYTFTGAAGKCPESQGREELFLGLLQAGSIAECQAIVFRAKQLLTTEPDVVRKSEACCHQHMHDNSTQGSCTMLDAACMDSGRCPGDIATFRADMAACLRQRAFDNLENIKDVGLAKRLYELAVVMDPNDSDSELMLWLVEKLTMVEDLTADKHGKQYLSDTGADFFPSFSLVEYVLQRLIEHEFWVSLAELCQWGITKLNRIALRYSEMTNLHIGKAGGRTTTGPPVPANCKKQLQTLKVATALGDLMPLCGTILAASRNHFNEDAGRLRSTSWQLFEELLCLLVGAKSEDSSQEGQDCMLTRSQGTRMAMASSPPYPGAHSVPLISRVRNPQVLTSLASLTAGWLHRSHAAGLTPWALAVERYGVLAAVTAGASLPPPVGSLPHAAAIYRPVPSKVSPEFGRDLFRVLLEGIIVLPEVTEGDEERGHCWFQGLADLAYEDEAYLKALQLYLHAGGIRSSHYCDPSSSMRRDIFSVWVIRRMINACRAIGAGLQAAILCQCLPQPDYEFAFRLLQEHSPILDSDAAAYFPCVWEVPILELLVHLHEKAGEEARVNALICYLQHPAMNVHNPQSIRKAHITAMEQRFLQRLSEELLG